MGARGFSVVVDGVPAPSSTFNCGAESSEFPDTTGVSTTPGVASAPEAAPTILIARMAEMNMSNILRLIMVVSSVIYDLHCINAMQHLL